MFSAENVRFSSFQKVQTLGTTVGEIDSDFLSGVPVRRYAGTPINRLRPVLRHRSRWTIGIPDYPKTSGYGPQPASLKEGRQPSFQYTRLPGS